LRCGIDFHPGVSHDDGLWEYAEGSVRDTADTGFSRGLIAIISADGRSCPRPAQHNGRCGEGVKAMATAYEDNVPSQAQPTQGAAAAVTGPVIRSIGLSDLQQALRAGWEDFKAVPSHAIILCVIYPVLGLVLARAVFGYAVVPLLFPLAAGFALLGPFAALGLYELSSRRERGEEPSAWDALDVLRSPSFGAMLGLGTLLLALFVTWVATAQAIYIAVFGYQGPASASDFVHRVFETTQGWWLIVVGCGVGFLFALVALCISVVSFPMMLDRHASAGEAMVTSLRVAAKNPVTIAAWGLIVAVLLVIGSLPFFLGLAVVIPLLGHATWHLYRRAIAIDPNARPIPPRPPHQRKPAADFPANLFPWRRRDDA
jgi:uncharacterized membrane protein